MPPPGVSLIFLLLPAFAAAYVRYSDTYIGKTIACTSEEKFCFRFNLLYNADFGKCAPLFSHCSENEEVLVVSKEEMTAAEPKLKARCGAARCPRHLESYFWPRGECLEPAAADVHCEGSSRTLNMFGEWECWCAPSTNSTNVTNDTNDTTGAPCPSPVALPQPAEDGRCTVPDLYEPYGYHDTASATGPCTEEEFHCYNHSQVLFQGQCATPLERGPCAEGEWVVLVPGPPVKATCAPRRCPDEHHVWVDASNLKVQPQCQPKDVIRKLLCPHPEELVVNAFGNGKCTKNTLPFELPNVRENGVCRFTNTSPDPGTSPLVDQQIVTFDAQPSVLSVPPQQQASPTPSTLPIELSPGVSTSFPVIGSLGIPTSSPVVISPVASTPISVASPPSTFQTVPSPGESTPLPVEVTPASSTPLPAVASPEVSTPSQIAVIPVNPTPFPVAGSPTSSGSTSSVVAPENSQQILVDPLPCVKPPCSISPAVSPPSNVQQVTVPFGLSSVEISTPTAINGETVQVNQDKVIAQLDTSLPAVAPVDLRITQKPLSVILQTPSTELLAPDVATYEQQLNAGYPVLASKTIIKSASPAILQNQTNLETVSFGQVRGALAASNSPEQSASTIGNQFVTQQIVEQPQQVPASNSQEQSASVLGNQVITQQIVEQPQQVPTSNPPESSASAIGNQVVIQQIVEQPQEVPISNSPEQSTFDIGNQFITQQTVEQPQQLTASNPPEQSVSVLGNQAFAQQIVEQRQQVPAPISLEQSVPTPGNQVVTQQVAEQLQLVSPPIPNSQLVTNTGIQTFPTIFRVPGAPVEPQQNVLLGERAQSTLPETPVVSQLLGRGQDHVHPPLANVPSASIPSTNVGPTVHPENVIFPQLSQQNLNGNVPPNTIQIIQNDPSLSSLPHATGLPFVSVQPSNGNIPLVPLHPEQNNYSSDLVQRTLGQSPITPVQSERQDSVVEYVLLGQTNVPVNSV